MAQNQNLGRFAEFVSVTSNNVTLSANTITFGNSSVNTVINSSAITAYSVIANGGFGSNGQALTSNGSHVYWSTIVGTNTYAQYTWSNVHTFSNNVVIQGNLTVSGTTTTINTFTVGTAAYFVANGNFGIGNSSPTNKLSVNGTGYFGANVTVATSVAANVFQIAGAGVYIEQIGIRSTTGGGNYSYRVIPGGGTSANDAIIQFTNAAENAQTGRLLHNGTSMYLYNDVNGPLFLGANGNAVITMLANGNIGVACTAPGGYRIAAEQNGGRAYFRFDNSNTLSYSTSLGLGDITGKGWTLITDFAANTGDNFCIYQGSSNSRRFIIEANGNIGVNITPTARKFSVSSSDDTPCYFVSSQSNTYLQLSGGGAGGGDVYIGSVVGGFNVSAGGSERIRVTSSGDVRVGAGQEFAKFNVFSGSSANSTIVYFGSSDANYTAMSVRNYPSSNKTLLSSEWSSSTTALALGLGGTEHFRIHTNGNVGIGHDTPPSRFVVKNNQSVGESLVSLYQYAGTSSSPTEAADWPWPVLSLRSCGDFYLQTMLTMGLPNDPDYQTDNSVWNFRLNGVRSGGWDNNVGTQKNTSDSGVGLELLGPGNLRMGTVNTKSVYLRTNGNDRLEVNSSGHVLKPYQPMVQAIGGSDWTNYTASGGYFTPSNAPINVGSCYNTSTGTFTCPVTGNYRITMQALVGNVSGYGYVYVYKNGSAASPSMHWNIQTINISVTCHHTWILNCAAGDTLKFFVTSPGGVANFYAGSHSGFTIELIG